MRRVVSLVPSITETLLAWGVVPLACTRFCEQPQLAHVGGTKDPDLDAIVGLAPDVVLMDREENRREDAEALTARGCKVRATHVTSVADVRPALANLAAWLGLGPAPTLELPPPGPIRRTAFVPIWRRPWMTLNAGTYGASALAACGIASAFADHPQRYPVVTLEEAAGVGADLVILPSEPYPFAERHVAEVRPVAPDVRLVDGRDLFWWGVRTPAALARLAQALS